MCSARPALPDAPAASAARSLQQVLRHLRGAAGASVARRAWPSVVARIDQTQSRSAAPRKRVGAVGQLHRPGARCAGHWGRRRSAGRAPARPARCARQLQRRVGVRSRCAGGRRPAAAGAGAGCARTGAPGRTVPACTSTTSASRAALVERLQETRAVEPRRRRGASAARAPRDTTRASDSGSTHDAEVDQRHLVRLRGALSAASTTSVCSAELGERRRTGARSSATLERRPACVARRARTKRLARPCANMRPQAVGLVDGGTGVCDAVLSDDRGSSRSSQACQRRPTRIALRGAAKIRFTSPASSAPGRHAAAAQRAVHQRARPTGGASLPARAGRWRTPTTLQLVADQRVERRAELHGLVDLRQHDAGGKLAAWYGRSSRPRSVSPCDAALTTSSFWIERWPSISSSSRVRRVALRHAGGVDQHHLLGRQQVRAGLRARRGRARCAPARRGCGRRRAVARARRRGRRRA